MNKIKILPEQEAQKIAAGEVVERPASIVKETIENSIDAKSTQISLFIEQSGKKLIRIIDNGYGMSPDDAKLCFAAHATSKIQTLEDLEKINSFGFRGEALASISAVSKVTLITKHQNEKNELELGTKLELVAGKFVQEKVSCSVGTNLQIKDLFYNTPVRKKFLKQDETEWNQILCIFNAFCLSNLNIHFKLYRDDKLILNAPAVASVKDRASQLWGHNFSQNLVELQQLDSSNIKISGFISNYNFWRYGRHQIFFFVNNRAVKNNELSKALLKGYLNVLPPARFPAVFIFINMSNALVDINVHPRKEEVKFAKPVTIQNHLQKIVTTTLENNLSEKLRPKPPRLAAQKVEDFSITKSPVYFSQDFKSKPTSNFQQKTFEPKPTVFQNEEIEVSKPLFKIIGQFLNTYILIENNEELVVIDQHAAHERILYEKFLQNFEKKEGTVLMFPQILNLSQHQIELLLKEKDIFSNQGIELDSVGQNQIAIKTSPPRIQNNDLKDLVLQTINFIEENEQLEEEIFKKNLTEHMHTQMACKAAVKAGDVLNQTLMQQIVDDLGKTKNRFICAHGRPTTWILSKYQIEKNFKRK